MISSEVIKHLEEARKETQSALQTVNNLIVEHEFQDMVDLIARGADALLEASLLLMKSQDVDALHAMERADEYVARVYEIMDDEIEED